MNSIFDKLQRQLFSPLDIASLVFFRIAFGIVMLWMVQIVWSRQLISRWWIDPPFLFKYAGFSWVQPWPGNGLYIHWVLLGVFALFVTVGFLYRISAALFCLSHTYFFLLDQGRYVNHFYLISLLSFLLIFVPANQALSIDAWLWPKVRSSISPAWPLWLLRAQIGAVYFFAGVAKINFEWLHGEPLRGWFKQEIGSPALTRFLRQEWIPYAASYASLAFDLLIVPFLFWRRTRLAAFCVAVVFHFLNAQLFPIDIFPWLAIAATTLFLSPSWPRRVLSIFRIKTKPSKINAVALPSASKRILVSSFVAIYIAIQILVPLRHFLYPGGIEWSCMEHRFSWQMMLERHISRTFFYVTDPNTGREFQIRSRQFLDLEQSTHMGWRPEMVRQFARFLAAKFSVAGPAPTQVRVRMLVSLNGRKPQLFLDPNVDLAAEPPFWGRPPWLLEIHDPLPPRGQDFSRDAFSAKPME